MAWTTPLSAVANASLTAAQWNASVRDNLLMTAPALASVAGSYFCGTGTNTIVERATNSDTVGTSESTTNTSYVDLTTVGPTVTTTSGARTFVFLSGQLTNNTGTSGSFMSFAVTGATTVAATDSSAIVFYPASSGQPSQVTRVIAQGLTPGTSTFRAKYRAAANTATFNARNIAIIPF